MFEEDVENIFAFVDQIYAISSKLLVELHFCLRNWPMPTPGQYFLEKVVDKAFWIYLNLSFLY